MFELALSTIPAMRQFLIDNPGAEVSAIVNSAYTLVDGSSSATTREKAISKLPQSGARKIIETAAHAIKNSLTFSQAVTALGGDPSLWNSTYLSQLNAAMTSPLS